MKEHGYPAVTNGSFMFAWASAAFLIALILVAVNIPAKSAPEVIGPDSAEIRRGRAVFDGEGCMSCHSRMVRAVDRGMGTPMSGKLLLAAQAYPGSSRIGPDLQNLDRKYPESLLENRLTEPQSLQPGTVMPSYAHLSAAKRSALISFLEMSVISPGDWAVIRATNGIEPAVPDELMVSLREFFDPETGIFIPPINETPEFQITGRGLYNSRCAACHGLHGRGDGPVSWDGVKPGSLTVTRALLVPPTDFILPEFRNYSEIMIYWRISEGVPGTEMPMWGGTLSEDAIWYLAGYLKSFGASALAYDIESEEVIVGPQERRNEELPGVLNDGTLRDLDDWYSSGRDDQITENEIYEYINSADSASEGEGDDLDGSENPADAPASAESTPDEEESL